MSDNSAKGARSRRFSGALTALANKMNASVSFDQRLLAHDVAGSSAHARMLAKQGIITAEDAQAIVDGLKEVQEGFETGVLVWDDALEDVHMNVEARLVERIGAAGQRLHTGRSRNDQVATDLRLYARSKGLEICGHLAALRLALVEQAEGNIDVFMPGYTHLQRAQPVRLAHHLMAYDAMFSRDMERVNDAVRRAGESPLGSGALAATTFPLDRNLVATELGFTGITRNSLDAVSDRDFAVELVGALALCQVHLSRLAEELVLWMSQEFSFATISQGYCSGSSIMPQKVNPDLAELIRGKTGRVVGAWVTLMTVLKGLPLAYNKDLQESQEPLFDAVDTLVDSIRVAAGMISELSFDADVMRTAIDRGYVMATELADYLAAKGLPFRQAHDAAGALVRLASERSCELSQLSLEDMRGESELFENDVFEWLDVGRAVDRRDLPGGPAIGRIRAEISRTRSELKDLAQDGSA